MQIHGPSEVVQGIEVTRLSASGSVALSFTGGVNLIMQSETDFDDLIRAAVAGKTLFLGKDDLSSAIAADVDRQTARVWAVFEVTDRGDVEVTDPKTWEEARKWAEVNALSFAGPLTVSRARTGIDEQRGSSLIGRRVEDAHDDSPCPTIGVVIGQIDDEEEVLEVLWDGEDEPMREPFDALRPARQNLDAQLTPPAEPGRDTDRPPTGHQLPALNRGERCDSAWTTGAAHGPCVGERHDRGQCMDATGFKFPYRAPAKADAR